MRKERQTKSEINGKRRLESDSVGVRIEKRGREKKRREEKI